MKRTFKILSVILTAVVIISALSIFGLAYNKTYFTSTLTVNGEETDFTENEYYRAYADFFGKYFYDKFASKAPGNKIDEQLYNNIKNREGSAYITVVLKNTNDSIDYGSVAAMLKLNETDVIAVCKSYPIAMVKIAPDAVDALIANEKTAAIYNAFPSAAEPELVNDAIIEEIFTPTAADARKILRYSAKLDKAPEDIAKGKRFFFMSDTNLDGKITAGDARTALRISAKLEKGKTYYNNSNGCGTFWQDCIQK